ncbi:hypothetical protein D3C87_1386230 [compost metagenome]
MHGDEGFEQQPRNGHGLVQKVQRSAACRRPGTQTPPMAIVGNGAGSRVHQHSRLFRTELSVLGFCRTGGCDRPADGAFAGGYRSSLENGIRLRGRLGRSHRGRRGSRRCLLHRSYLRWRRPLRICLPDGARRLHGTNAGLRGFHHHSRPAARLSLTVIRLESDRRSKIADISQAVCLVHCNRIAVVHKGNLV